MRINSHVTHVTHVVEVVLLAHHRHAHRVVPAQQFQVAIALKEGTQVLSQMHHLLRVRSPTVGLAHHRQCANIVTADTAVLPLDRTASTAAKQENTSMRVKKHVKTVSVTAPSVQLPLFAPHALLDITSGQVAPVVFNAVVANNTTRRLSHVKAVLPIVTHVHHQHHAQHAAVASPKPTQVRPAFNAQEAPISMEPWKLANPVITHV